METFKSVVLLFVFGAIARGLSVFLLNAGGAIGAMIGGSPGHRSMRRFVTGSVVSCLGQSLVYLAYTAFIVTWSLAAIKNDGASWFIWLFSFIAVIWPIWSSLIRARLENREFGHAQAQVEGLHISVLIVLIGFVVFAFWPKVALWIYGWVPLLGDQIASFQT